MLSKAEVEIMKLAIVTQIACGSDDLRDELQRRVNAAWTLSNGCNQNVKLLKMRLRLIELAQAFTRNMIDTASASGSHRSNDKFDSANYRDTQSQRTGQGTSAAWSKATTFQQFQRDSAQHARSQSDSTSDTTGKASSYLWDRSQRVGNGWAHSYNFAFGETDDSRLTQSGNCDDTDSEDTTQTGKPEFLNYQGAQSPIVDLSQYIGAITFSVVGDWWNSWWGGSEAQGVAPVGIHGTDTNAGYTANFPTGAAPSCASNEVGFLCEPISNYGGSRSDKIRISVAIPGIGVGLSADVEASDSANQRYVCNFGTSTRVGDSYTVGSGDGHGRNTGIGKSQDHSEEENVHDRHRSASAYRNSEGQAHASTTDTMRAHGEAHNGSDSSAHGESQAGNQSTAYGVSHSEGLGDGFTHSETQAKTEYWSQIFKSLADMRDLVWREITIAEAELSAGASVAFGNIMATKTPCCDVRHSSTIARAAYPAVSSPFVAMGRISA